MTTSAYRQQDEATRELISTAIGETLFVEAGAGTGKTRALVDRVVALVLSGVPVDRIAAITFTERAAAELRDRVRNGLEGALAADPGRAGVIGPALESLDRAQISTIHAFCQALLRSYAAEAGIDPDFDVQDEVLTERRRQERWRVFLEGLGNDEGALSAVDRLLGLGLGTRELERLALELSSRADLAEMLARRPLTAEEPDAPNFEALHDELCKIIDTNLDPNDRLRIRLDGLLAVLEALMHARDQREAVLATGAQAIEPAKWNIGRRDAWRETCEDAREIGERVAGRLNDHLRDSRSAALAAVLPYVVRFVLDDEAARGREGALTFDDLILRMRDLLRRSNEARTSLRQRYDALLIDEFQDTDPLQVEIALAFAANPTTGELEPGRLFLVGDPKQSIYRFRRADMAVYADTQERVRAEGGRFLDLALNKRSRPAVLAWVNGVFEPIIGGGENLAIQPAYRAIYPDRETDLRGPGVARFGGELEGLAREVRRVEAEEIAALCRQAIEGDLWEVQERSGEVHLARYRDIAILIPRRTGLITLERALAERRIPYRVEGGSLIYRTQEVRDLINCLTAIDDPADEVAIVAALRSPAFACSDVDLARYKASGGRFNYRRAELDGVEGRVADGLRTLARFHVRRHESSIAALVEEFVGECGQVVTGILDQGDRNSFRRARFMAQQARTFESARPESLRAFVAWLERQAGASSGMALDNEGAGVDDDEDAVRILTIHGAKGLEFPIVIMAGLAASPIARQPTFTRDYAGDRVAVRVGTKGGNRLFLLGDYDALSHAESDHDAAEFARVLYVGATRARDHLVVSLYHGKRSWPDCAARRLIAAGAAQFAPAIEIARPADEPGARPFEGMEVDLPAGETTQDGFAAERAALVAGALHTRYTSATAIKAAQTDASEDDHPERADETEPWSRGRARTRIGRAVHAAVQSLPLDADDATIEAFARAQAVAEGVPHREREVVRLVGWLARESPAWQRAREAPRAMREVPFAMELDGAVLEGYIDLVIETPAGIEIVDWKTDQVSEEEVEARMQDYRLQAGLYVAGLEAATGRAVSKVTYVFATPREEREFGDPAALADDARALLSAPRTAAAVDEPPPPDAQPRLF